MSLVNHISTSCAAASAFKHEHFDLSRRVLSAFKSADFRQVTAQDSIALSPEEWEHILSDFIEELSIRGNYQESLKIISKLADQIPLEKLQQAILKKYPNHKEALLTAESMLNEARYYLEKTAERMTGSVKTVCASFVEGLLAFIDGIISVFSIEDLFKPSLNEMDAQFKMGRIMMLASLFMMLASTLLPLFGVETGGMIVGATMISLGIFSLIYRRIRPRRRSLPEATNLTKEIQEGRHTLIGGRREVVQKIGSILSAQSEKLSSHVMLLGRSGVGKTQTVHAFVQAIERGEFPLLKGKTVFYFNMADLVNSKDFIKGGNKLLKQISDLMGRAREQIILVFDEIHLACQIREDSAVADQLKTFLDPQSSDRFPYVIGLTTELEFFRDIYKNNPALARRFTRIVIENTDETSTLEILNGFMLQEAPEVLVDTCVLRQMIDETNRRLPQPVQPGYALRILGECVRRISEVQKAPAELEMEKTKATLDSLHAQGALDPLDFTRCDKIVAALAQLAKLEKELSVQREGLEQIKKLKIDLVRVKKEMNRKVVDAHKKKGIKKATLTKQALLGKFFLIPALDRQIRKRAADSGVKAAINMELVREVIQQDMENEERVRKIIEQGKKEVAERSAGSTVAVGSASAAA